MHYGVIYILALLLCLPCQASAAQHNIPLQRYGSTSHKIEATYICIYMHMYIQVSIIINYVEDQEKLLESLQSVKPKQVEATGGGGGSLTQDLHSEKFFYLYIFFFPPIQE